MTSPVEWITLGAALWTAGVGTTLGTLVTIRSTREQSRRDWERDHVTDRYVQLQRALSDVIRVVADVVEPVYLTTPVGDVTAAWDELSRAWGRLNAAISEVVVVARPCVLQLIINIIQEMDLRVLAPRSPSWGPPPIAVRRSNDEIEWLAKAEWQLTLAMRIDLGLSKRGARKRFDPRVPGPTQTERSLSSATDVTALRQRLCDFQVRPFPDANADFGMTTGALTAFQMKVPGLRRAIGALLALHDDDLTFALIQPLAPDAELAILRRAVRCLETSLRDGPGQRDTPEGGRVIAWDPNGNNI